ncbi:family transcriptional regulator [Leptolyngbya sp. Heron Island J]|uniref:TetR/AcrR family transcriptional regulator n=1 Tax=Leptolyngbya sp. Heron Island J TaxID=1385935 RepID=UPI0003B99B5F|nr:TetR/AcrR family transcriptional regulator [Leptolyngbya sp. Heron Island J]ESA33166.1 family transcriptional regulator [Leptolyngbya sp. Heron Island J]
MAKKSTQKPTSKRTGRDAEQTKQQILDAAELEFAKHGLQGARTEAIAKGAGVASRMIYYYFENKVGLYQAVLQRPATEVQDAIAQIDFDSLSADQALAAVIRAAIAYETKHRHRGMLLFQEASQNQGKYFMQTNWQQAMDLLTGLLEQGIQTGVFRPLNLQMTTLNIIGVCVFYGNAHENLKHLTPNQDLLSEEMVEQYTQAAINLILKGVQTSSDHQ